MLLDQVVTLTTCGKTWQLISNMSDWKEDSFHMINELELLQYKDWTQCQRRICADLWTLLVYFSDC